MRSRKRVSDGAAKLMRRYCGFICIDIMRPRHASSGSISTTEAGVASAEIPAMLQERQLPTLVREMAHSSSASLALSSPFLCPCPMEFGKVHVWRPRCWRPRWRSLDRPPPVKMSSEVVQALLEYDVRQRTTPGMSFLDCLYTETFVVSAPVTSTCAGLQRQLQPRDRWSKKEWLAFKRKMERKAATMTEAFRRTSAYQHKRKEERKQAAAAACCRIARMEGIPI